MGLGHSKGTSRRTPLAKILDPPLGVEHLAGTSQLVLPMPPKIKCRTFALPRASASRTPVLIPRKLQSRPSASNLIVTVTLNPNPQP